MNRVAVATSGGRDSTALLHATARAMRELGGEVHAFHVHHGLQPQADEWLLQVRRQALRWGVRFDVRRLTGSPAAGQSVEAWARQGRYSALTELARAADCKLVLLAHHRRDQAETWLLQALRGGTTAGLSSMPRAAERSGIVWARPWLDHGREAIEAYVRRHRLTYVDDPSNGELRFARNRLRRQVWPALVSAFPDAEDVLAAAAVRAQHSQALVDEVLALDLPTVAHPDGLHLPSWLGLPPARRRVALTGWLGIQLRRAPPDKLVDRLIDELPRCRSARWGAPACELRLYRGVLRASESVGDITRREPEAPAGSSAEKEQALRLDLPGTYVLPGWGGALALTSVPGRGAAPERLREVFARERAGGERFRLAMGALPRSLKKQYQFQGVPAWNRGGPLLFDGSGRLIFAPGLGVDADAQVQPDRQGLHIVWMPAQRQR